MIRTFACCSVLALVLAGCQSLSFVKPIPRDEAEANLFGPAKMRIHPIFTQIKDWTGDNQFDGIEAELEFQDQFGDPTKAAGKVLFELYTYRRDQADPRGQRVVNPWIGSLSTIEDQRLRWNRTSRTYSFQLACPGITSSQSYVLTAVFEHSGGRRFFSQVILEAQPQRKGAAAQSAAEPATRPAK